MEIENRIHLIVFLVTIFVTSSFAQWTRTNGPGTQEVFSSPVLLQGLVMGPSKGGSVALFAGSSNHGVFRSTDEGASWAACNFGLTDSSIETLIADDSNLFAGTMSGVFRSTNNGISWSLVLTVPTLALAVSRNGTAGTVLFAGMNQAGVLFSTDEGDSWSGSGYGFYDIVRSLCVASNGAGGIDLFAGTEMTGVFLSTDNGITWSSVSSGLADDEIPALVAKASATGGTSIFAGTFSQGVFRSTDIGVNWTYSGLKQAASIFTLYVHDTSLYAGALFGIFRSTDDGVNWAEVDSGIPLLSHWVVGLAVDSPYMFAATFSDSVWRCLLQEMVAGVDDHVRSAPSHFSLSQNYPNPFNPSTVISYQIPVNSHVALKVFDVLGREVATLVNERENAGRHSVMFNAANVPSGVYFYRLEAGSYHETKKLLLLK